MKLGLGSVIFGQQRDQLRRVFVDVWRKQCRSVALEPMEQTVASVIGAHPQYHGVLADPASLYRDFSLEASDTNPFLHMAMHIAIMEQILTDRPVGIRAAYDALRIGFQDTHELEHAMMECLSESLREAHEHNRAPDEHAYLACIRRLQRRML